MNKEIIVSVIVGLIIYRSITFSIAVVISLWKKARDRKYPTKRDISLENVLITVDEWLKSDDTYVENEAGDQRFPYLKIGCKKGSLLTRLLTRVEPHK